MQNNSITSVRCMADWLRKDAQYVQCMEGKCLEWHPISKPEGAREGDIFVTSQVLEGEPFAAAGIREGDSLIFLITDEIQPCDLVALYRRDGNVLTGYMHFESTDRFCLHSADNKVLWNNLTPQTVRIIGRVVEVQRMSRAVVLRYPVRPIHASWDAIRLGVTG